MRYRWSPVTARIGVAFALLAWVFVASSAAVGGTLWEVPAFGGVLLAVYFAGLLLDSLLVKVLVPLLTAIAYLFPTWLTITDNLFYDIPPFTTDDVLILVAEVAFSVSVTMLLVSVAVAEREHDR